MRRYKPNAHTGLWLTCGGLLILAAHHLLTVYEPRLSTDNLVLLAGGLAGYLATAMGIYVSVGRRSRGATARIAETAASTWARGDDPAREQDDAARCMTASFLTWCDEAPDDGGTCSSFDQLIREMLVEQVGAVRVRCYQVLPGDRQLRRLSQPETVSDGSCAPDGILGHVAATGQEFVAGDPTQGELIRQLAEDDGEAWAWVLPIRRERQTVGLIAVGKLPTRVPDRSRRQEIAALLTLFWRHAARLEQLRIAEKTDKGSGLLTRADFFRSAMLALADSYAQNEPVVVVVLGLEGLRRLDDTGRWRDRDALVETTGRLIRRRIRTDDVIGRFSDERFVLLLRRLDSSLGRLITTKIQETIQEQIGQLGPIADSLHVRAGLTGSGFQEQALEKLLASAFDAVERARREGVPLHCDSPAAASPDLPPADGLPAGVPAGSVSTDQET